MVFRRDPLRVMGESASQNSAEIAISIPDGIPVRILGQQPSEIIPWGQPSPDIRDIRHSFQGSVVFKGCESIHLRMPG